jgi:hypothetical protein
MLSPPKVLSFLFESPWISTRRVSFLNDLCLIPCEPSTGIALCVNSELYQCFRGNFCCLHHLISHILPCHVCHFPANFTNSKFSLFLIWHEITYRRLLWQFSVNMIQACRPECIVSHVSAKLDFQDVNCVMFMDVSE